VCRLTRVLVDGFDAMYAELDRTTLADLTIHRRALARVLVDMPARTGARATPARAPTRG
jgi:hypothetical protein